MLSSNGNQYLRPEYLNPLPTTMDSKKSPLALLAQTCSQIGADPPPQNGASSKTSTSSSIGSNNSSASSSCVDAGSVLSPPAAAKKAKGDSGRSDKLSSSPMSVSSTSAADKATPKPTSDGQQRQVRPVEAYSERVKASSVLPTSESVGSRRTPTPGEHHHHHHHNHHQRRSKSSSPKTTGGKPAPPSPTDLYPSIPKSLTAAESQLSAYKSLMAAMPAAAAAAAYHPAAAHHLASPFHHPHYTGAFGYGSVDPLGHYASALNHMKAMPPPMGFAFPGYQGLQQPQQQQQQLPYGHRPAKTSSSADCRDPYCTGCPSSNGLMPMVYPSGCLTQCDPPKVPLTGVGSTTVTSSTPTPASSSSPQSAAAAAATTSSTRPYVCNWIVGDNYCGKRFGSSDELLQHLRTHTNLSTSDASLHLQSTSASAVAAFNHPLLQRSYPTPPLSPLSAARYHPYAKGVNNPTAAAAAAAAAMSAPGLSFPGLIGAANSPSSFPSPLFHPALAPYYSHLSQMYGTRIGAAPLPP